MRSYTALPALPIAGPFDRYRDTLGLIVPVARTNLVLNPSLETNTTGYTAVGGSIARSTADQYHGAYSLAVTPSASTTSGAYYGTVSLTSGTTYAVSCKVRGVAGRAYALTLATTGGVDLVVKEIKASGLWQWVWLFWTETSTTTRRVYVRKNGGADTSVFYVDGLQVEACGSEGVFVTTYIDGDQKGLLANQFPPAYLWGGTPHASTSSRSGLTRAGGRVVNFVQFGFLLTAIIGLGLAPVRQEALNFAQLDGAQYQDTIKTTRSFTVAGRMVAGTPQEHDAALGQLARLIDRDRTALHQPLVICGQAQECGVDVGDAWSVAGVYTGGLAGSAADVPTSQQAITFDSYLPWVAGRDGGSALTVQQSLANVNYIVQRLPTGQWSTMQNGMSGGVGPFVETLARGPDGTIYAGGIFLDAGGSGADYIAQWSPQTQAWSVIGSATAGTNWVRALAVGPDGSLYVGGTFLNWNGIANADYIAKWDGSAWSALGTGMNNAVLALAVAPDGTLYAGGNFTTAGGGAANYVAKWNGAAWSALGTGMAGGLSFVSALTVAPSGTLYVGGDFTSGNGVSALNIASWNGTTFAPLGSGANASVNALTVAPNNLLYAGGGFTTLGGVSAPYIGVWNGAGWAALGAGLGPVSGATTVRGIAIDPKGIVLAVGSFTQANGITLPDRAAQWNGSTWTPLDAIDLPGAVDIYDILLAPDGTLVLAGEFTGAAVAAALTTVTNAGTAATYPTLTLTGPSSGSSRIYQLVNVTTGATIYMNLTLSAGETAVLTLDPTNVTFVSTFQGNILRTILPGSNTTAFALQPGANTISMLAAAASVTATLSWSTRYASIEDTLAMAAL